MVLFGFVMTLFGSGDSARDYDDANNDHWLGNRKCSAIRKSKVMTGDRYAILSQSRSS
jgi:hypothetical protein